MLFLYEIIYRGTVFRTLKKFVTLSRKLGNECRDLAFFVIVLKQNQTRNNRKEGIKSENIIVCEKWQDSRRDVRAAAARLSDRLSCLNDFWKKKRFFYEPLE